MSCNALLKESIAASLETNVELLGYMPELLEDLEGLGTDPDRIVDLLRPLLPLNAQVLDLACGKGAVSTALALHLGCHTLGIDAMPDFIEQARFMAAQQGVASLCRFEVGDIRDYSPSECIFDAVIFGAAGAVLGTLTETVGRLRRMVKPGGLILLDDGWRVPHRIGADGAGRLCSDHEPLRTALTAYGDEIIIEDMLSTEKLYHDNAHNNARIHERANVLTEKHPEDAAKICAYVSRQLYECYLLEHEYQCAQWIIRTKVYPETSDDCEA